MENIRILLTKRNAESLELAERLRGDGVTVSAANCGVRAVCARVETGRYDMVLICHYGDKLDELLEGLGRLRDLPKLYLINGRSRITRRAESALDGVLEMPGDLEELRELTDMLRQEKRLMAGIHRDVSETLKLLEIKPGSPGHRYLSDTIEYALSREHCTGMCKEIYPVVAGRRGTTAPVLERDISRAVRQSWGITGTQIRSVILGRRPARKAPTNTELVRGIVDMLRCRYDLTEGRLSGRPQ